MACDLVQTSGVGAITEATPERFATTIQEYEAPIPTNLTQDQIEEAKFMKPSLQQYNLAKKYQNYTVLQLRKEAMSLAGKALDYVTRGNQKPVFDPRTKTDIATLFPEYSQMRALGRLAVAGAYVAFAEGRSKQGTQYLCDAIILGQNLTDGVLIARLVGIAIQSTTFAAFEKFLPSMSLTDAQLVEALAPKLLITPPAAVVTLKREFAYMQETVDTMFDREDTWSELTYSGDEDKSVAETSAAEFVARMSPTEKKQLIALCKRKLARHSEQVLASFRRPESSWDESIDDSSEDFPGNRRIGNVNDLADYLSYSLTPVFSQLGSAEIRNRTQIRLLALAGSIIRFRWEHDRWPTKLIEAAGERAAFDPASNDEFQYEIQGSGFRVYSKGSKTTGEIALKYKRPASAEGSQPPPP